MSGRIDPKHTLIQEFPNTFVTGGIPVCLGSNNYHCHAFSDNGHTGEYHCWHCHVAQPHPLLHRMTYDEMLEAVNQLQRLVDKLKRGVT